MDRLVTSDDPSVVLREMFEMLRPHPESGQARLEELRRRHVIRRGDGR